MIYSSGPLDYPPDKTLTQILLDTNLNSTPSNKPAIVDGPTGKVAYTYRSFRDGVNKLAAWLHETYKTKQGMTVAILMTNTVCFT